VEFVPWALIALFVVVVTDLTLFGWTLRVLRLGWWFDGPASGERVALDRTVSVYYGQTYGGTRGGWGWNGRLIITDRRIVSCYGYWSRVAVLEISRAEVTEVRRDSWWLIWPCVRVGYRRKQRLRSFSIVNFGFRLLRAREDTLAAFRTAGYPVVA
jgi:hypothetical protein